MKICWLSNAPAPYKMELFELLSQKIELLCVFETHAEKDREKDWYIYNHTNFKPIYLDETPYHSIKQELSSCDLLVNGNYSSKYGRKFTSFFKRKKKVCLLQADGGLAIPRGPIDYVISYVMRKYDGYLSPGSYTDQYFTYYKVDPKKIHHYHFTSLKQAEITQNKSLATNKIELRKQLQMNEDIILFSVGQQIPRKGYDILMQAMANLDRSIGLYIAGGNPEENVQQLIDAHQLTNVHFIGFKSKEDLKHYYATSDLFILPTRYDIWGLVINEALSFGLPVITTDHCVAGLQLNTPNQTSLIVPIEDVDALTNAIQTLTTNKELYQTLSNNALDTSNAWTLEAMCEDLIGIFNEVIHGKN